MSTITEKSPPDKASKNKELHVVCMVCDPNTGFCGTDVSNHPWDYMSPISCIVCAELWECPKCGE